MGDDEDEDVPSVQDDLFALGSVIYEIWTGEMPCWRSDDNKSSPSQQEPRFPDMIGIRPAAIIVKCWRGQYQTATQVAMELRALEEKTNASCRT